MLSNIPYRKTWDEYVHTLEMISPVSPGKQHTLLTGASSACLKPLGVQLAVIADKQIIKKTRRRSRLCESISFFCTHIKHVCVFQSQDTEGNEIIHWRGQFSNTVRWAKEQRSINRQLNL